MTEPLWWPTSGELQGMADELRSGDLSAGLALARGRRALRAWPPAGDRVVIQQLGRDFAQGGRDLDQVALDLDTLRRDRLPVVWEGLAAREAAGRLREMVAYAEHASEMLGRIGASLTRLGSAVSYATTLDLAGREDVRSALSLAEAVSDSPTVETSLANGIEKMAKGAARLEQACEEEVPVLHQLAGEVEGQLLGASLLPAEGTPPYEIAQQDLDRLPAGLIELGIMYAQHFGVPERLVIALLMQEQPFWGSLPQWAGQGGFAWMEETAGRLGLGKGTDGETSVGRVSMQPHTALGVLEAAGYSGYSVEELRTRLTYDPEFAVAVAVLHLKLDLDSGMTEKQAYLSYAVDQGTAQRLTDPADPLVQNSDALSPRSMRYDANIQVLDQAGDLVVYYGIETLGEPKYGQPGGFGHGGNSRWEV